jgi:CoA-transferase family III
MTGVQTPRSGNSAPLTAPADLLHCADGEIIVSAYLEPHWRRFAQAIGAPELLTDRRFSSGMDRAGHRAELVSLIQRRALSRAGHKLSAVGSHEDALTERIERQVGVDGLLEVLAERLPPTDLQSLLLAAYRRRAAAVDPSRLLERYRADRFVAPAGVDPRSMAALEVSIFSLLPNGYEGVEISPLCPLGTNSAIASVDQNNVVTTIRNTEVVADVTNVLALECAVRRGALLRGDSRSTARVKLAASHRVVRAQSFGDPGSHQHFRLLGLVAAGRDQGSFHFEVGSLLEQLTFFLRLLGAVGAGRVRVAVTDLEDGRRTAALQTSVLAPLATRFPHVSCGLDPARTAGRGYYVSACFDISKVDSSGQVRQLVDGGFTTWTQQLLNSRKERLLIGGLGTERLLEAVP